MTTEEFSILVIKNLPDESRHSVDELDSSRFGLTNSYQENTNPLTPLPKNRPRIKGGGRVNQNIRISDHEISSIFWRGGGQSEIRKRGVNGLVFSWLLVPVPSIFNRRGMPRISSDAQKRVGWQPAFLHFENYLKKWKIVSLKRREISAARVSLAALRGQNRTSNSVSFKEIENLSGIFGKMFAMECWES